MYLEEHSPIGNLTTRHIKWDLSVCRCVHPLSPLPSLYNTTAIQKLAGKIAGLEFPPNNNCWYRAISAQAPSCISCILIFPHSQWESQANMKGQVGCAVPALFSVSSCNGPRGGEKWEFSLAGDEALPAPVLGWGRRDHLLSHPAGTRLSPLGVLPPIHRYLLAPRCLSHWLLYSG